ncbi:MAG: 2,3-bisphosphoglycerate-independent phosphoglycerate mutase [Gammaproteobacteria bacterium]|nr:2,3-bisphosphoglycerate-independent phosphoglycerate mutase [Gammaproteobacteria bacterium]
MTTSSPKALIILDGWGQSESSASNAIKAAKTPTWDALLADHRHSLLGTSGADVGLPEGQMGNSEVGHMNIGAGRVVYQNYTRIGKAIVDGGFDTNEVILCAIDKAVANKGTVHICGLLSDGGVHSHQDHLFATCRLAHQRGAKSIVVHAWLDGRDTAPSCAQGYIEALMDTLEPINGRIGSLCGRYFAMDRDQRWDRIESAYRAMRYGEAEYECLSALNALQEAYLNNHTDEFVPPTVILDNKGQPATIKDGDAMICVNFRPDRSRQITRAFVDAEFNQFDRGEPLDLADFVMMTQYSADIDTACAFPPSQVNNDLGEVMANHGKTQLRIAETEKYAHVTFFFSGGQEALYPGESRELIPSPNVATYDLQPEMSAPELTDKLVAAIKDKTYDLIVCNFANADMVGHTGKFDAAVQAVEAVDACLTRIVAALEKADGEALITADHGNVELMINPTTGQPHTAHTLWPVPLVYVSSRSQQATLSSGVLADLAPTLLHLMGVEQPEEMTGSNLVEFS